MADLNKNAQKIIPKNPVLAMLNDDYLALSLS